MQKMRNIIDKLAHRHDRAKVFRDFLEMTTAFMLGKPSPRFDYTDEELELFTKFMDMVVDLYEQESKDWLGELYMTLAIESGKSKGQYFTPHALGAVTSELLMTDEDIKFAISRKGYVSIHEPACGSGALIIAFANRLKKLGYNPRTQMFAYGMDLDLKSVQMAFISATLLCIPLVIDWGDTLEQKPQKRYKNMHFINRFENPNHLEMIDALQDLIDRLEEIENDTV